MGVVNALADSAVGLGIRTSGDAIAEEIEELLADPLARFTAHPNWPSAASPAGVTLEFSVAVGHDGTPSTSPTTPKAWPETGVATSNRRSRSPRAPKPPQRCGV